MRAVKKIGVGFLAALAIVTMFYVYKQQGMKSQASLPQPEERIAVIPDQGNQEDFSSLTEPTDPVPVPHTPVRAGERADPVSGNPVMEEFAEEEDDAGMNTIDPVLLAEAELALVNNRIYEEVARETLPTLSIQTHDPIWVLEDEAAADVGRAEKKKRSGPFGTDIQPAENEIWLRIPPDYAAEHRDIMAENADLYRAETGTNELVTVMLWVGGRPYARQQYE